LYFRKRYFDEVREHAFVDFFRTGEGFEQRLLE